MKWLREENASMRETAAQALGALGPAAARSAVLAQLVERLRDEDFLVRGAAARALGALGPAAAQPTVLAQLVEWLREENIENILERKAAAQALGTFASHGIRIFKRSLGTYQGMHITVLSNLADVRDEYATPVADNASKQAHRVYSARAGSAP